MMDVGLLVLRLVFGLLLAGHGAQKITHLFGGTGLRGGAEEFKGDGFRGGALTVLAVTILVGTMVVAVTVKWHTGFWVQHDGIEFPLVMALVPAALAFTGPGAWSLDSVLRIAWPLWVSGTAVAARVIAGLSVRSVLHECWLTSRAVTHWTRRPAPVRLP